MRRVRAEFTAAVGGQPDAFQRVLIERAVMLSLRIAQIDAMILAGQPLTEHDSNFAIAWNGKLRLVLADLRASIAKREAESADPLADFRAVLAGMTEAREAPDPR